MNEEEIKLAEAFEKLDEKSQEFLSLQQLDMFIEDLNKKIELTDEEKITIDGEITLFLLKINMEGTMVENLFNDLLLTKKEDVVNDIIKAVKDFVTKPKEDVVIQTTTPQKQTVLIPTKRDYSLDRPITVPAMVIEKKFDPYHEPVDEK